MNVNANCETKNENNEVPFKKPKVEMDVKPKIEKDFFKVKSEPIDDFNRGIEIIGSMNSPFKTEIQNENFEFPYKRPKIEMEIKNEKIEPKMEMDIKPKIEQIDDINRGMEIVGNMKFSIKAEHLENYKCPVCNLVEFSAKNQLIQHMTRECVRNLVLRVQIFPKKDVLAPPARQRRRRHASALCKTKDYIAVQRASIGTDARFINFM